MNTQSINKLCILTLFLSCIYVTQTHHIAEARPNYVNRVPTSFSCSTCHIDGQPKSIRNSFGIAFLQAGLAWAPICDDDSDMDGFSNGAELNDPDCLWVRGTPLPMGEQSRPGDANSIPAMDPPPPEATCNDSMRNGNESDTDCGGPDCDPCGVMSRCLANDDCASGLCSDGLCQEPVMAGEMAGETAGEMAGETAGEIAGETAGEMAGETAGEMAGETAGEMAGETAGEVAGETAGEVAGETAGEVAGETAGEVAGETAGEVAGETAGEIAGTDDLAGETAGESTSGMTDEEPMEPSSSSDTEGCTANSSSTMPVSILFIMLCLLGVRRKLSQL